MIQKLLLPDSGIEVTVKKVSPLLFVQLRRQFPPPQPPRQKVLDINQKEVWEENLAHPDYLEAKEKYELEMEERMGHLLYKRGVDVPIDTQALTELKEFWKTEFGIELTGDDKELYIQYFVIVSANDKEALQNAVLSLSQPTQEDLNAAQQAFRGKV
jgi:hypothetical protein